MRKPVQMFHRLADQLDSDRLLHEWELARRKRRPRSLRGQPRGAMIGRMQWLPKGVKCGPYDWFTRQRGKRRPPNVIAGVS